MSSTSQSAVSLRGGQVILKVGTGEGRHLSSGVGRAAEHEKAGYAFWMLYGFLPLNRAEPPQLAKTTYHSARTQSMSSTGRGALVVEARPRLRRHARIAVILK